jgi:hypothetical protein
MSTKAVNKNVSGAWQEDAVSQLILNFALQYAIRKAVVHQVGMKL